MTDETTVYELTLLLSTEAAEERRAQILSELEAAIQRGGGAIVGRSAWGARNLAYRIERQHDAEFHLLQITGPPSLLEDLNHTLRITDGVLRFRIIKAVPGSRGVTAVEQPRGSGAEQGGARERSRAGTPIEQQAQPAASEQS
jgi:small subunit ribosomal protein S6